MAPAAKPGISHLSLGVNDLPRACAFYDAALSALGWARVWTTSTAAGYGPAGGEDRLAVYLCPGVEPSLGMHVAFEANDEPAVQQFHAAAVANGGSDDGLPGPRPQYGESYFAAFVRDPDGHRLEAVFQAHAVARG